MEYGLQVANLEPQKLRDVAQTAEGLGYDLITFPDHIVMEGPGKQYDPHARAYDHIVMATMVAGATKKIRIGHLVLCNLFRHPVITAQALMTLDHVSNGRMVAGLGTGWTETEFNMTGIRFPHITERLRMLDEALSVISSLWTQERTTFAGEFYQLKDAILWPKPIQKHVPVILGGSGKGLLRIAAKHADYVNIIQEAGSVGHIDMARVKDLNDDAFKGKVKFLHDEATRAGRAPAAIKLSNAVFQPMLVDTPQASKQTAEMMAGVFGTTPEAIRRAPLALIGTAEEWIVEMKRRVKEWGISQFIFSGAMTGSDDKLLRRIKEDVCPHV